MTMDTIGVHTIQIIEIFYHPPLNFQGAHGKNGNILEFIHRMARKILILTIIIINTVTDPGRCYEMNSFQISGSSEISF